MEIRTYLGFETQRQWSYNAISRSSPLIFALFSIVVLTAYNITKSRPLIVRSSAWYAKSPINASFSDVIATVKAKIWKAHIICFTSSQNHSKTFFNADVFFHMLEYIVYSA